MKNFVADIIKTIIGAILIAVLFFVWKNYVHKIVNVSGLWEAQHIVLKTSYPNYEGLTVFFDMVLQQSGTRISGTGEKVAEKIQDGKKYEYEKKKRVLLQIDGNLKSNLFTDDIIFLHIFENGLNRHSSASIELEVINDNEMVGTFHSTASDAIGKAIWERI